METKKTMRIIVNGRPLQFDGSEISYEQVVELAKGSFGKTAPESLTVTYTKPGGPGVEGGSLTLGKTIELDDQNIVFNVTASDKA